MAETNDWTKPPYFDPPLSVTAVVNGEEKHFKCLVVKFGRISPRETPEGEIISLLAPDEPTALLLVDHSIVEVERITSGIEFA